MPSEKQSWNWIDALSKVIPEPYTSIFLIAVIYIIYLIYNFSLWMMHGIYPQLDFRIHTQIFTVFITIPYLFIGVLYFTNRLRCSFQRLEPCTCLEVQTKLYNSIERKFTTSKIYYILVILIVLSYVFIPPPDKGDFLYYTIERSVWAAIIDIINWLSTLLILYLMSTILWITINISWALSEMVKAPYENAIKIDLSSADKVGGLGQIRDLILYLAIFQFGSLTLAILNFHSSLEEYGPGALLFISIFLFSIYLFLKGWSVINKLLEDRRKCEISTISRIYQLKKQSLLEIISDESIKDDKALDELSKSMKLLESERLRLLESSRVVYDYRAIFTFFTSSLIPFITGYIIPYYRA